MTATRLLKGATIILAVFAWLVAATPAGATRGAASGFLIASAAHADAAMREAFLSRLPFTLTGAQRRTLDTLLAEMAQETAMSRLVQGDVGVLE